MPDGRSQVTWWVLSTGICACVFLVTVVLHEAAHGLVWLLAGADGVKVRLGRVVIDGVLPRGTNSLSMAVLAAGPLLTAVQAVAATLVVERRSFRHAATATTTTWAATTAAAYVAYALLTNHTGNDIGRLLRAGDAPPWASEVVAAGGILLFLALGLRCPRWFAEAARLSGTRGAAVAVNAVGIGAAWLIGVVIPFWLVVGSSDGVHALGMAFFVVIALVSGRPVVAASAGASRGRVAAACLVAGTLAWGAAVSIDRAGGLPLG